MPESAASKTPYTQPMAISNGQAAPPSQPNTSDRQPLASAIATADGARPHRSESQPPIHTPAVPIPAINAAHLPPSAEASTAVTPPATSTAARKAASQPRLTYSSNEWPV